MIRILFFGSLPLLLALTYLFTFQTSDLEEAYYLRSQILTQRSKQAVRQRYGSANHFYIDEELESLSLLDSERSSIEELLAKEPTAPSRTLLSRLQFLSGNRLIFQEGSVTRCNAIAETEERLAHPVELNSIDLQTLLSLVEENHPGRPQLIVTDLRIGRKKGATDNETFVVDLQLLKREFEE